jgi:hypothetical protein
MLGYGERVHIAMRIAAPSVFPFEPNLKCVDMRNIKFAENHFRCSRVVAHGPILQAFLYGRSREWSRLCATRQKAAGSVSD